MVTQEKLDHIVYERLYDLLGCDYIGPGTQICQISPVNNIHKSTSEPQYRIKLDVPKHMRGLFTELIVEVTYYWAKGRDYDFISLNLNYHYGKGNQNNGGYKSEQEYVFKLKRWETLK